MAHNTLTGSSPANGARLADPPPRIELMFLSRLTAKGTKITVTGPDNVPAADGPPSVTGAKATVPFQLGAAGLYIVDYEVVSADGHTVRGEIRFTMTVGATPTAVPTATPGAVIGSTPPVPASQPEFTAGQSAVASPLAPLTTGADTKDDGSWWPWLAGALVVLALVAGVLLRRRSRTR